MRDCINCAGTALSLGTLGYTTHYRCQDCGIQFSVVKKFKGKLQQKKLARYRRAERRAKEQYQRGEAN